MRSEQGFTLIELMVTVIVLAILAAVAGPALGDFFQRYRLRGAADEVASLLASSRAEAMMRNRDVAVTFVGTGTSWCVGASAAADPATAGDPVGAAASCDCSGAECSIGDRTMERNGSNYSGVSLPAAPGTTTITFNSLTGAVNPITGTAATFKSPNGHYSLRLQVSALGRGQLCVPSGSPSMSGIPSC